MTVNILILIIFGLLLSACTTIDRGSFGQFNRSLNTTNYGYLVIKDPTKTAPTEIVEAFEVRQGDCSSNSGWSDCKNDRERSELSQRHRKFESTYSGDEYWYGWSIYFPIDYPNIYPTKVALGQFHQRSSHPVWMFQNSDGGYYLDDQVHGYTRRYYKLIDDKNLRGKWHRIELHVKWAKDKNGFFVVWADGKKKINYKGQTMDAYRVYFKYGIYRSFMSRYKNKNHTNNVPTQVVYFSNVKRGKSREDLSP